MLFLSRNANKVYDDSFKNSKERDFIPRPLTMKRN